MPDQSSHVEHSTHGLEVQVWLRCESTEELWRLNQALPEEDGDPIPPPEGRRDLICTWTVPEDWTAEPGTDPEPWQDALLFGIGQASYRLKLAEGIGVAAFVYAVRVQPVGAKFKPLVAATTSDASRARAETEEPRING